MATKLKTEDISKRFEMGTAKLMRVPQNQNDPIYNVGVALENYTGSVLAATLQLINGMNELLERVEKIELMLQKAQATKRP